MRVNRVWNPFFICIARSGRYKQTPEQWGIKLMACHASFERPRKRLALRINDSRIPKLHRELLEHGRLCVSPSSGTTRISPDQLSRRRACAIIIGHANRGGLCCSVRRMKKRKKKKQHSLILQARKQAAPAYLHEPPQRIWPGPASRMSFSTMARLDRGLPERSESLTWRASPIRRCHHHQPLTPRRPRLC